ncbi:hypothetical protein MATL_G00260470 [Megalops atlanticus]|uniref:Guanylate kinase-like domain-containing protein n=1 Tax=Megalops atlanticus TaxID=7932 RepID=A0A9D3PD22_MEGAT|nr:hypothetical protein MATL_G00260470 [Megalops atlanticus]
MSVASPRRDCKRGGVVDKDLRHYLNLRFQKGSVDHELQQIIRDNLYLRTVPCTTRQPKEGEVPGVDYNFVTVDRFMELEKSGALLESGTYEDNYYGTPKPPAEPTPLLLNVAEQLLPGARPSSEGKRKRNKSVSNMERASIEPPEEEEEERPVVNGNGVAITPESSEQEDKSTDASGEIAPQPCPAETATFTPTEATNEEGEPPNRPLNLRRTMNWDHCQTTGRWPTPKRGRFTSLITIPRRHRGWTRGLRRRRSPRKNAKRMSFRTVGRKSMTQYTAVTMWTT